MHQGRNGRLLARPPDPLRSPFCESYSPLRSCDGVMRRCAIVSRSLFRICSHPTSSARAIKRHQSEPSVRQFSEQASGTHVAFWGNGDFGRLGLGHSRSIDLPEICSPHSGLNPRQVACGGAHSLVLSDDGKVFAFGLNDCGQLAQPSTVPFSQIPVLVAGLPPITSVAAGHHHSAAISEDGHVYTWGANGQGELGLGSSSTRKVWHPCQVAALKDSKVQQVALGAHHSLALTQDGEVFSWGSATAGQLGLGPLSLMRRVTGSTREARPRLIRDLQGSKVKGSKITFVATGHQHSACVDDGGALWTFGYGRFWQLGTGSERDSWLPRRVGGMGGVERVDCGGHHSCAVTVSGALYSWGANENGCLGLGGGLTFDRRIPEKVEGEVEEFTVTQVACGWKHTVALTAAGRVYAWGWGGSQGSHATEGSSGGGQLGLGHEFDYPYPVWVKGGAFAPCEGHDGVPRMAKALQVSCGFNHSAAILQY